MRETRQGHLPLDQCAPGPVQAGLGHLQGCHSKSPACEGPRFRQCTSSMQVIIPQKPGESTTKHFPQKHEINRLAKGFQSLIPQNHSMTRGFVSLSSSIVYWWRGLCSHPGRCWPPPQLPRLFPGSVTSHTALQGWTKHMHGTSQGEFKFYMRPWNL